MAESAFSLGERDAKGVRLLSPVLRGALLAGVFVHLAGFLIFKVTSNPLPSLEKPEAFVRFVSQGSLAGDLALEEQAALFDSAPLFVPTEWNAAQSVSLLPNSRVRERFPAFEPEIDLLGSLNASNLPIGQGDEVNVPQDLLKSPFWTFFRRFAQSGEPVVAYPVSESFAEVLVTGAPASMVTVAASLNFTDTSIVPDPVRLYLRVSGGGQTVGRAIVAESSGNTEFDAAALDWLRLPTTVGQLPSGYLSIVVYP